jgi:hypothetical protein
VSGRIGNPVPQLAASAVGKKNPAD